MKIFVLENDDDGSAGLVSFEFVRMPEHAADIWWHNDHVHFEAKDGVGDTTDFFRYEICNADGLCDRARVDVDIYDD